MGALIRYGQKFKVKNLKKSNAASKIDASPASNDGERRQMAQDSFNTITEAANALLLKGKIDIYDAKSTDIEAIVKEKLPPETADTKIPTNNNGSSNPKTAIRTVQWEYQGNQDGKVHGPFSTEEMLGWANAGYFVGAMAVQVRTITHPPPTSSTDSTSIKEDLLSDLLDDDDDDENGNTNVQTSKQPILQRGEWIISDKVDFHKYLMTF